MKSMNSGPAGELIRLAGWSYFPIAAIARLPQSMLGIGVISYLAGSGWDFASTGLAAAGIGLGVASGAPLLGASADRWGQRRVLLTITVAYLVAVSGVLWAGGSGQGFWVLVGSCYLAGLTVPQVGPLARVRWLWLLPRDASRLRTEQVAQSYESTVDELSFVLGPALVGILAAAVGPAAPLIVVFVLAAAVLPWFALHPTGRRPAAPSNRAAGGAPEPIDWPIVAGCVAGMSGVGVIFGLLATASTAVANLGGAEGLGGLVYACLGLTSGIAALSVSRWPLRWLPAQRWVALAAVMVPIAATFPFATSPWLLAGGLLLLGLPIGPVLVTIFSIAGRAAPTHRLAFVMTLLGSGNTLGAALGNAAAGALVETSGVVAAMLPVVAAALVVLIAGLVVAARLRSRTPAATAVQLPEAG